MIRNKIKRVELSSLFPLLLLLVFGVCIVTVLLMGVRTYRNQLERDRDDYERRTAIRYITTRLHQNDNAEDWSVASFEDPTELGEGDTLYFYETLGGVRYCTRIYCYNGYLYELFTEAADVNFLREDGQKLLELHTVRFIRQEDGVCVVAGWDDGYTKELYLFRRSD